MYVTPLPAVCQGGGGGIMQKPPRTLTALLGDPEPVCWIYTGYMLGIWWVYAGYMLGICWVRGNGQAKYLLDIKPITA